jgi:L-lysine 2,3-aminomutase
MAKIGDESLFLRSRPPRTGQKKIAVEKADQLRIEEMKDLLTGESIVETGSGTLTRLHETRVAIHASADETDFDYMRADNRITDVVIVSENDAVESLYSISNIIKKLQEIPHVNAVRLRSLKFNYAPEMYTPTIINRLGELNRLTIVNPLRLEIETWFLKADEIQPEHATLTRRLNNKGITVYSNTPLLGGTNDSPDDIHTLAYVCRQAGIEFHHLYVAGLPVQKQWNTRHPVDMYDVIDIATTVRREGSGREIPRYIIRTPLGEVDYGLTSSFVYDNGNISIKLDCYPLSYFQNINPDFSLPDHVSLDQDGKPVVQILGMTRSSDFPI